MRDVNLWTMPGNLTKDPTLNHLDDGTPVCHFRVAVSARRNEAEPAFVDVTAWRRDAEHCSAFLKKGSRVFVAGHLEASIATLSDGRTFLDLAVDARMIQFMGGPKIKGEPATPAAEAPEPAPARRPSSTTIHQRESRSAG